MSPEFRLLVELCRLAFAGDDGQKVAGLGSHVDWPRFLNLACRHRVEGLVAKATVATGLPVPDRLQAQIRSAAADIAAHNLRSAAESKRLAEAFGAKGIPLLFVKGLTLGVLAYSDASTKAAVDMDLLVAPSDVGRAAETLRECGWKPAVPTSGIEKWHRLHKESIWQSPVTGLQADLHSRLADNSGLIPSIGVESPRQEVDVTPGIVLQTLATDELFAYLTVHGASSAWFRLKWITDFAALLFPLPGSEIERRYARSQELAAGRAPAQALLLADRLYGILDGAPALAQRLAADWANRQLAAMAWGMLERLEEPTERHLGTLPIHLSQLLLMPGLGFKLGEAWRQARTALR